MEKNISECQIWDNIITHLNKANLKYILVGGAALAIHGLPRSTLDIDIYIKASEKSLVKIFAVADELKLDCEAKVILKIKHTPKLYKDQWITFSYADQDILDVFLTDKVDFDILYKRSEIRKDKTLKIRVASLSDIRSMKKSSGREIDLADLKLIKEIKKYE